MKQQLGDGDIDAGPIDSGTADAPEVEDLATMCGAEPTTLEEWETCYLKRFCEMRVHCEEQNLYTDAQECIAISDAVSGGQLAFEALERQRAVTSQRASLDAAAFTQCLVELSPHRCSTAATAPICASRFVGTVGDSQPCYTDIECASPGARCEPQNCGDSCCLGTCKPRARLGEPCMSFEACEPGLMCSTTTLKCVLGDINAPCSGRYDCDPGAWCGQDGVCKPDLGAGELCDSLLQCGGETSCVGLMREIEPARCRRVTQVGDVCDWYCLGNLYCDLSNPQGFGVCRSLPEHGQACGALTPCIGRADRCDQGSCVTRADVNEPCSDGTCMPGLFCTDQLGASNPVCRARMPDGTSGCNQPLQCESYICDGDQNSIGKCQSAQMTCP